MLPFYRKATAIFLGLIVLTALIAGVCARSVFVSAALFPANESVLPWTLTTFNDVEKGGSSSVSVSEDIYSLDYEYRLDGSIRYPSVIAAIAFSRLQAAPALADL